MSEWISVKDGLPEDRVEVLAYGKGRYSLSAYLSQTKSWLRAGAWRGITHWRPLDSPPASDSECRIATLRQGEDGYVVAEYLPLVGCMSQGIGDADALRNLADAIESVGSAITKGNGG